MTEQVWRERLIAAARRDYETRARLAASGDLFIGYHPEMEAVHNENAALLDDAFDAIGWPGRDKLSDDGAAAAFVILQHAIGKPDIQRRGLELMLEQIPLGAANALDAAYLADRIATFEGREQTFGTQFDWDSNGQLSPSPTRDIAELDDRRASVGLPPIADAIAEMRANAAAEGQTAPADLATRRAKFEIWARRVGWRA
ncbi:MAG: hypothetical protein DCF16_00550 [Alphaproteobacteria bacterium]|nr:MAG: hypothetical protein DCF16_00550 [Alphaproteobacteria bacterium]